jgi:AcrR family transcriptional regulator
MPADPKTRRDAPRRGRPPKSVPQGTDLRCALVDAAALEIRESGYHATSSNRIAARAGLSAGAFYNYFQDKVDVLLAVHEQWVAREWEMVRAILPAGRAPTLPQVKRLVAALVGYHADWVRLRHAWVALSRDEPRVAAARAASRRWQIDQTLAILGRRPSRRLRSEIALVMLSFEATADSLASAEVQGLDLTPADLMAPLTRMLHGLVAPPL